MPTYRYQFCDLWTDDHIVDLPLTGVTYSRRIVKAGTFSAAIPIPNRTVADQVARILPRIENDLSTGPGRTLVHVWRNGDLWGSYVIWSGEVSADSRGRLSAQISGASLESWLHRRFLSEELNFTQVDQLTIARRIVDSVQHWDGYPGGGWADLGVTVAGPTSSGVLRDRTYPRWDAKTAGERLEQLSEVINGPEWMIRTYPNSSGQRVREFYVAPMLGQSGRLHTFSQPGNVVSWRHSIDATDAATKYTARGEVIDTTTDHRRLYTATSSTYQTLNDWAMLEAFRDYPTTSVGQTLGEYAEWWLTHRGGSAHTMEVTVRLGEDPTLTPDRLGEYARLVLVNDWFPLGPDGTPTFDQARRVIGMDISPPSRTNGQESATLLFEGPRGPNDDASRGVPLYARDLGDILARTHRELRSIVSSAAPIGT